MGDMMRTRRTQSMVSVASRVSRSALTAALVATLGVSACAGRQHPVTRDPRAESAESTASAVSEQPPTDMLQFDNLATVYVDVYLVGQQIQWRLGRVPPGMRASLRVPESAIDWSIGFLQLTVIPSAQVTAQA